METSISISYKERTLKVNTYGVAISIDVDALDENYIKTMKIIKSILEAIVPDSFNLEQYNRIIDNYKVLVEILQELKDTTITICLSIDDQGQFKYEIVDTIINYNVIKLFNLINKIFNF